jgi:hypothetical protein
VKRLSDSKVKKSPSLVAAKGSAAPGGARPRRQSGGEVGDALRKVYDKTLDESIPAEMLDLLGKLD